MDPLYPNLNTHPNVLPPERQFNLALILAIGFGLAALILGILAVVGFSNAQHERSALNSAKAASYQLGKDDQHKTDQAAALTAAESPYRNYTAPGVFGGFQIYFPKNWNAYVVENDGSQVQVNLILNPDVVKSVTSGNFDNTYAMTVQLVNRQAADYLTQFQSYISSNKLKSSSVTVAGITSTNLTGQYDSKHSGRVVLVPVRDKTMVFTTTGNNYDQEFTAILTQSKINP